MIFEHSPTNILSALEVAISPVILISGLSPLLLTMTNRLGRAIDRSRLLSNGGNADTPLVRKQIDVLMLRARFLRRGILCAVSAVLGAAILVMFIFLTVLFEMNFARVVSLLFIYCMAALIVALTYVIREVNLSLEAIHADLKS